MDKQELNRRKLLSGILATGGAGGLVGRGTAAIFTDEETFTNNNIQASASTAGVVDMGVNINSIKSGSGVEYEITLPEDESEMENNPSYIWVRTKTCPDRIADALRVQLRFCGETVLTGSAREVLDYLASGVNLGCPGDDACLQPGDTVSLQFDVIEVIDQEGNEASFGNTAFGNNGDSLSFDLEFYAQQCRYGAELENPFEDRSADCNPGGQAISSVAFCPNDEDIDVSNGDVCISEILAEDNDEPTSLVWETDFAVKYVVVNSDQTVTIYDYSGLQPTKGIVSSDGYTAAEYSGDLGDQHLSDDDSGGESCLDTSTGTKTSYSSVPCQLAADVFDKSCPSKTGVKLQDDEDELEPQHCEEVLGS